MASGLLQLQGVGGLEGWKWLFIVDCILTLIIATCTWCVISSSAEILSPTLCVLSFVRFYLPLNAATTKGGLRGFKPWFTERQVQIAVTRVIRDDPAKRHYEYVVVDAFPMLFVIEVCMYNDC